MCKFVTHKLLLVLILENDPGNVVTKKNLINYFCRQFSLQIVKMVIDEKLSLVDTKSFIIHHYPEHYNEEKKV